MAMIRRSDLDSLSRDALVLNLGDLLAQGEAIRTRAEAEAERVRLAAEAERVRLVSGASEVGQKQGYEEGLRAGTAAGRKQGYEAAIAEHRQALQKVEAEWQKALEKFEGEREEMLIAARRDLVVLAVTIARRVVRREIEVGKNGVVEQFVAALEHVARPTRLTIVVHPEDQELLRAAIPALCARFANARHVDVISETTLERGACLVRTGEGGSIDAGINAQIERIAEALIPPATPTRRAAA